MPAVTNAMDGSNLNRSPCSMARLGTALFRANIKYVRIAPCMELLAYKGLWYSAYANLNESATRAICIGMGTATPAPIILSETTTLTTAYIAEFD